MADNNSQPGPSAGTSNVNNNIYGTIEIFNQYNHLSTYSQRAKRRNPINNIELAVDTFIGRETELNDIMLRFHKYPVVVIAAMGGMGKTQLARKFASINADVYRDRYWINAETEEQLLKSFDRLARKVKVDAKTDIDTVRDTYRSFTDSAALLIFDNAEHVKNVYGYLPTRIQLEDITLHVLITSRCTEWTSDSSVTCYQLQPWDISVSLQLFQRKFGQTCIESMQDKWEELARTLGYLPLALQVATSYIYKRTKHNSDLPKILADYMKELRKGAEKLLNDPLTEYDSRSISTSMLLTLQQLENKTNDKRKLPVIIINAAAYMNPDRIYKKNLLKLIDKADDTCLLDEALVILTEFSLFNQGVDREQETLYSVHRIIQTSIRHNQSVMGTAGMYYTGALKCEFVEYYLPWDVFQYANERASAVVDFYKTNPSPTILKYLVKNKAIAPMEGVLKLISKIQVQSATQQQNLLYNAVEGGDINMIQLLCKYGADINQQYGEDGEPPLHHALRRGNNEIATWLLENGAAPTVQNREGYTALHVAAKTANHEMISRIIKTDRAAVHVTDNNNKTPLISIDYSKNEEDIVSTINILVENNADIARADHKGNTVLHYAARRACATAVELILQLNKHLINEINEDGQTALDVIPVGNTHLDECIRSTIRVFEDFKKVDIGGNTSIQVKESHNFSHTSCAYLLEGNGNMNHHNLNIRENIIDEKPFSPFVTIDLTDEPFKVIVKKAKRFFDNQPSKVPLYRMRGKIRGAYLGINNMEFIDIDLPFREGAQVDEENMKDLFTQMGFNISTYRNQTYLDMTNTIKHFSSASTNPVIKRADCLVIAIMSHGEHGGVLTSDGGRLSVSWILDQFNNFNCPEFQNKPKIFIFQMNRDGDLHGYGLPGITDMLIAFSTLPGDVSYRNKHRGSYYIQSICEVFMNHAYDTDIEDLLKMVDQKLSHLMSDNKKKQTSTYELRAFKRCYLHPGLYE